MEQYIDKSAVVAEVERKIEAHKETLKNCDSSISEMVLKGSMSAYQSLLHFLDTLEVKEVDLDVMQRMEECPYRRVGCTMYADKILDCNGACSWVVDYPKVKELKAQKGE